MTNASGVYEIRSGDGADTLIGGGSNDTFKILGDGKADSDTINGGDGSQDTLELWTGTHTLTDDSKISNLEIINAHASGSTLDLTNQVEGFTINGGDGTDDLTGGEGNDTLIGGAGDDTLKGGGGNDTLNVDSGSDIITLLGGAGAGGEDDVLVVSATATATALDIIKFEATVGSSNSGTAILGAV